MRYSPDEFRDIFDDIELDLIKSLRRTFSKHITDEKKEGFKWEQWQRTMLRNIGEYRNQNKAIVGDRSKEVQKALDDTLRGDFKEALFEKSVELDDKSIVKGFENTTSDLESPTIEDGDFFRLNDERLNNVLTKSEKDIVKSIKTIQNDTNKAENLMISRMDKEYRKIVRKVRVEMEMGAKTYQQAVDAATKDFLKKGLDVITYKNGAKVHVSNYLEMHLRTSKHQMKLLADGAKRDEMGVYTVISSVHANCCEHCAKWQGRLLIDDVFTSISRDYARTLAKENNCKLVSDAMYEMFLHPNCRHTLTTFFVGKSTLPTKLTKEQADKAVRLYKAEQKQRAHERKIREWKRIKEGSQSPGQRKMADVTIKHHQKAIREILKENTDLRRSPWREKIITNESQC